MSIIKVTNEHDSIIQASEGCGTNISIILMPSHNRLLNLSPIFTISVQFISFQMQCIKFSENLQYKFF